MTGAGRAPGVVSLDELAATIEARRGASTRYLVGIAGPPASGKSTVASELAHRLGPHVAIVAQDGFHLADEVLERRGLRDRKGAPETFDGWGFVAALERVGGRRSHEVWLPRFDRTIEDSIAQAVAVAPDDDVVLVEGNYLLADVPPWRSIGDLLDLRVYVELDDAVRVDRLVRRHVEHGRSPAAAVAFAHESDERNARLVAARRDRADLVLRR